MDELIGRSEDGESESHYVAIMNNVVRPHSHHLACRLRQRGEVFRGHVEPPSAVLAVAEHAVSLRDDHAHALHHALAGHLLVQIEAGGDGLAPHLLVD